MVASLVVHGVELQARESDRYVAASPLAKAAGKKWNNYIRAAGTQAFLEELASKTRIRVLDLVQVSHGGAGANRTWIHPHVLLHFAQWASPEFAVQVTGWAARLLAGEAVELSDAERAAAIKTAKAAVVTTPEPAAVAVPAPDPMPLLRQAVAEARHASAQMIEMREEMRVLLEEVNGVKLRMSVPLPPARDEYRDDSQRATDAAYAHVHGGMTQTAAAQKYRVSERNVRYMAKVLREDASLATLVSWGRIAVKHAALALTLDPATRRRVAYTATAAADITAAARRRKKVG